MVQPHCKNFNLSFYDEEREVQFWVSSFIGKQQLARVPGTHKIRGDTMNSLDNKSKTIFASKLDQYFGVEITRKASNVANLDDFSCNYIIVRDP